MSLQDDFEEFQTQIGDTIGDENPLELYFRKMWEETEISPRRFRNIDDLEPQEISGIVTAFILQCGATPFRQRLYRRRWDNLQNNNFQNWLGDLYYRIDLNEQKEYLAVYVTRVLRGEMDSCVNEDVGTILSQKQNVWRLAFDRLNRNCEQWEIR